MLEKIMWWLLDRLHEKSTWLTILTIISTVFGINFSPEYSDKIIAVGMSVVSLVAFSTKEKK